MNWVGGSRPAFLGGLKKTVGVPGGRGSLVCRRLSWLWSRVLVKQERRRQKEYFEKKRLKSRMQLLGVLPPVSNSSVSLDLLNLRLVNQISCRRSSPAATVRRPTHVDMSRGLDVPPRKRHVELPLSPPLEPPCLCLDGTRRRPRPGSERDRGAPPARTECDVDRRTGRPLLVVAGRPDALDSRASAGPGALGPPPEAVQFGTVFERANSPGRRCFLAGRPAVVLGEDGGAAGQPGCAALAAALGRPRTLVWGKTGEEASSVLADGNWCPPSLLPEDGGSFPSADTVALLRMGPQSVRDALDGCGWGSSGGLCPGGAQSQLPSGDGGSNVPSPELPPGKAGRPGPHWPSRDSQEECGRRQGTPLRVCTQKDPCPSSPERRGPSGRGHQAWMPLREAQGCPMSLGGTVRPEAAWPRLSPDPGGEETAAGRGRRPLEDGSARRDLYHDSPRSSPTAGCSPQPAGGASLSVSPETPPEEEGPVPPQGEGSGRRPREAEETGRRQHPEVGAAPPRSGPVDGSPEIHQGNVALPSVKAGLATAPGSAHSPCWPPTGDFPRRHAWAQTALGPWTAEAAVQCDLTTPCPCGGRGQREHPGEQQAPPAPP
ncbi:uncharacterized protein C12orf40 homolog [Talpa occidentalis]|uniref:uncharacterized protein C12orf40 homolog n=1 Tax=Talpa occidentalis TaxID=50954 RepID=UPI00188E5B80|nr:uncharacterized protein C12orf40 homolog [Talpa occidentalis]